jgi:tetratricopeptide (TPR) repeat protein
MLAALGEQTDRPSLVIHAQTRLPSSHPQSSELIRRSAAAVLKAMDDLRVNGGAIADGRSVEEWSRDAARLAEALLAHTNDSASQVTAARLLASSTAPDHRRVLSILQRVENAASRVGPATDEQTTLLQQTAALRLVSHVALGEYPEAAAILERVHSVSTDQLLGILTQLRDAGRQLKGAPRTELAQLELAAITRIRLSGQKLNDEQQQLLIECEAEALFATDRFEEAARLFGEAFRRHPALRSRWAESLERTGRKADLERAVAVWRELEAEQRQGTIPWFEMRLRHARSLMLSERRTEARKLIASTRLVYQELGSADLARRYQEVEDQASGNSR